MIYDFIKADEMMDRLSVDPIQFHLLFLLYHRKDAMSTTAQLERFKDLVLSHEDPLILQQRIDDLYARGLIDNFNNEGAYGVDKLSVTSHFESVLVAVDCGEELWRNYPTTFPLSMGGRFIARTGDKDAITADYEKRIRKDLSKHKSVLEALQRFKTLVASDRIHGVKIENFVKSEMWDVLNELDEHDVSKISNHGEDI